MSWQTSAVMHAEKVSYTPTLYQLIHKYIIFGGGVIPCLKKIYFKWHFINPPTTDTQDPCIKLQTRLHTVLRERIHGVCWLPSMSSLLDTRALEEFYYLWLQ